MKPAHPKTTAVKLLFLFVVAIYLVFCYFNYPSADDYSYSVQAIQHGWSGAVVNEYNNWGGRYTSAAILSANPMVDGSYIGYKAWSAINIITFLCSLYLFFASLFKRLEIDAKKYLPIFYVFFAVSFLSGLPSTSQGLYWLAGYVTYTFPLTLMLLLASYLLRVDFNKITAPIVLVVSALFFILAGFNETIMFMLNSSLWSYLLYSLYTHRALNVKVAAAATACLAGGLVVLMAPGNKARGSHFDPTNPLYAVWKALGSALEHIPKFMSLSLLIAAFLLMLFVKNNKPLFHNPIFNIKPFYTFLAYWAVISLGFFPAQLSMGGNPDLRVDNVFYLVFMIFFTVWCIQFALRREIKQKYMPKNVLLLLFFLSAFIGNTGVALFELSTKAANYREQWISTINESNKGAGEKVTLPAIDTIPKTISFETLSEDSGHWVNQAYSKYFKLESISTYQSEPTH